MPTHLIRDKLRALDSRGYRSLASGLKTLGYAAAGGVERAGDAEVGRVTRMFAAAPTENNPLTLLLFRQPKPARPSPRPTMAPQLSAQAIVEHHSLCECEGYIVYRSLDL